MTAAQAAVYLLPPRPRTRDWPAAGACAGLLLGLAELLMAFAAGPALPARLALLLAACDALLVALPCAAVGVVLRLLDLRASHSALVVGVLGPLLYAAVAPPLLARATPAALGAAVLAAAGVGALAAGAAILADRAERAGVPASGPLVWGATSLLLAGSAQIARGGSSGWSLALAALLVVGATVTAHEVVRRRGSGARMGFGRLLVLLALACTLGATAPRWLPWVLVERELPAVGSGPANLLIVALGAETPAPTVDLLAWDGVVREGLGPETLLALPGGGWLGAPLFRQGYATASFARDPARARAWGAAELDARPADLALLRGPASWTAAAPILAGPAAPLVRALGGAADLRPPAEVAADAQRWLLRWRTRRATAPFFLVVDLRGAPAAGGDAALAALLAALEELEAAQRTWVAASVAGPAARAVVRPPPARPAPELPRAARETPLLVRR